MRTTEALEVEAGREQANMVGEWSTDHWELQCTLPYPVGGVNRLYRSDRGHVHKSARARQWQAEAAAILEAAGLRPLPEGDWGVRVDYDLFSIRADIDSCIKSLLDSIEAAGIPDGLVTELRGRLRRVRHRCDQRLGLRIIVNRIAEEAA